MVWEILVMIIIANNAAHNMHYFSEISCKRVFYALLKSNKRNLKEIE